MKFFIDAEFNDFGGELISFALVREDGDWLYLVFGCEAPSEWVAENVMPLLYKASTSHAAPTVSVSDAPRMIQQFLKDDPSPVVIADWPDDIRHMCDLLITGPGMMINIPTIVFQMIRVNAYPTTVEGAIHHNAYWDAMALRQKFIEL